MFPARPEGTRSLKPDSHAVQAGHTGVGLCEVSANSKIRTVNRTELAPVLNPDASEVEPSSKRRSEVEDVLASSFFKKAPTLSRLLVYLWEQRDEEVSEYAIATEALGRRPDFDPREDATVRVLVSRLRIRLKDFYGSPDGVALSTHIVIPVGGHQVQVVEAPKPQTVDAVDLDLLPRVLRREVRNRKLILVQAIAISLLVLLCIGLMVERNRAVKNTRDGRTRSLAPFWRSFLENGKNTRIILPAPLHFGWGTGFLARDVNVNEFAKIEESPWLRTLLREWGKPGLSQRYVSAPDALAALSLDQYLDQSGLHLTTSTTAESSVDAMDRENLILMGTPRTLVPFQAILSRLNFQVDAERGVVVNQHPASGEPRTFETVQLSSIRLTTPGVLACLPGSTQGTHVLVLEATYYTSALISYLTSESGLAELQAAQRAHGNTTYFEAVIVSEINGSTALRSHLVEFHPISSH